MATFERRPAGWRVKIRRRGFPQRSRTFDTKAEAERWARDQEASMDAGRWRDMAEAERTTLADALDRYEREVTPAKKGARQESQRIAQWQGSSLAERSLASIRGMDLADWRDSRLNEGRAPSTIRNDLTLISHLYRIARTEWGMEGLHNPVQDVRRPRQRPGRERRLEPGEEERLRAEAGPEWNALLTVALETAMRRGELVSLRWANVYLRRRVARLPETKNDSARDVPLSSSAVAALESLPRDIGGRVFRWTPDYVTKGWRELCRRAGVRGLTFHDLRHEATSRLVESGRYSLMEVAAITGHKTMVMLKRYTQLRAEELARKMD